MGFGLIQEGNSNDLIIYLSDKAQRNNKKLVLVDDGIAYRINDYIYMNRNLFKYKQFCLEVFNHELGHDAKLTKKDLAMDLFEGSILTNLAFCFKHPRGFKQFIPIGKLNGNFYIDINLIIVYLIITLILIIIF